MNIPPAYVPIRLVDIIVNEFFPYRKIRAKSVPSSNDEIVGRMENKEGYIKIEGETEVPRGARSKIVVLVIKSTDQTNEIKRIHQILESAHYQDPVLNELFLVVNDELYNKKNFTEIISKNLYSQQKGGLDEHGEKPYYTVCPYDIFIFSIPKCKIIFPHEIMTQNELNKMLKEERITVQSLPEILTNDPSIIWNGGRVGQVVRIVRNSESSLQSIYYRKIKSHM